MITLKGNLKGSNEEVLRQLFKDPLIRKITALSKQLRRRLFLVGGYLRDFLLGVEAARRDLDFAVDKGAIKVAKRTSKEIGGSFVLLDEEHGCARVVYPGYTVDFTDFRGRSLQEDLAKRDFSINAFALDLESAEIIDPYHGIDDLRQKVMRVVSKESFSDDPARILRTFGFAAKFGFHIEDSTVGLIGKFKHRLPEVAAERICDEFFEVLQAEDSAKFILLADQLKVLDEIFPEIKQMRGLNQGPYHHLELWGHSLQTLKEMELYISELKNSQFAYFLQLQGYLSQVLAGERRREQLLKLASMFHDVGKPQACRIEEGKLKFYGHQEIGASLLEEGLCQRLRLSTKESQALRTIVLHHLRPGYLAELPSISRRASFRFFRDAAQEAPGILLLAIADKRATRGPLVKQEESQFQQRIILGLMETYFEEFLTQEARLPKLLTGNELMEELGLSPGPLVGKILEQIQEAQFAGEVTTKSQAIDLAKRIERQT